jgi:phage antirepressor YoqD-like protein
MNELTNGKTMTVKEVAEVLGVTPEAIKKHTREMYPEILRDGVTTYLNEEQVTAIKQTMIPTTQVAGALTSLDIERMTLQVIEYHVSRVRELEKEVAVMKPKAEFFNQVADSHDALQMRDVAATLNLTGWGRNRIFKFLREQGVLDSRNIPYREYEDRGYFRVIEQKWTDLEGETRISLKTLVYQRGVDYIRRLITNESVPVLAQ